MIYKNAELYNIQQVVEADSCEGLRLSRIPENLRMKLNQTAQIIAFNSCGCEIRFNLIGDHAKIVLRREKSQEENNIGIAEFYHGCFQGTYQFFIGTQPTEIIIKKPANIEFLQKLTEKYNLPFDANLVRVILPYDWQCCLVDLEGEILPPKIGQTPQKKYLAYGSSITHGGAAVRPTGTYTMRVAQILGVDLINLGFAGSAHLEAEIADYIAERKDWDFATLELGINVIEDWSVDRFAEKVDYLISRIAKKNADKWIFCTDLFPFYMDYHGNTKAEDFRRIVRKKVEMLNLPKLVYISGYDILTSVSGLTFDILHPSAHGMEEMARNFAEIIKSKME